MILSDINPFLRFAQLQPSALSYPPLNCSYDYRIFYVVDGSGEIVLADKSIPLSSGTLLYFRPGTPYYFNGKVKIIVLNFDITRNQSHQKKPISPQKNDIDFKPELIFENNPPAELQNFTVIDQAFDVKTKIQDCLTNYRLPTPFSDAITSALLKSILCYIAAKNSSEMRDIPELIKNITLYIQKNYDKEITNESISATFSYHAIYLNRLFKKHTGMTLHQAILAERIRIAKRLLRSTNLSVYAIAEECGFTDRSQFCTAFRKKTGLTPTEYKNQK